MIKNRHGQFLNEEHYIIWCKINNLQPFYSEELTEKDYKKPVIDNNYDVKGRCHYDTD